MCSAKRRLPVVLGSLIVGCCLSSAAAQGPFQLYEDPTYDVLPRPMASRDPGLFNLNAHRPPNLLSMRIGRWQSNQTNSDLYQGVFAGNGVFLRIDLVFAGLVNPPGNNDPLDFHPFRYGPNPVYGFIECDVDDEKETGGELVAPEFRYLANVARFGGLPAGSEFDDRLASRSTDLDNDFTSPPYIERSGEEFHWALLGNQFTDSDIIEITGNGDLKFTAGEEWRIVGDWFHRAHGFEDFSFAIGGVLPGEYLLSSEVRFLHDDVNNTTMVSLLAPMTNTGAAIMAGLPPEQAEPNDGDTLNQASIAEALEELTFSALLTNLFPPEDPEEILIEGWQNRTWAEYLNPRLWRPTALLGTSYSTAGNLFVWSDVYPNVIRGDIDGEFGARLYDRLQIDSFIDDFDAISSVDDDAVPLDAIGETFSVFDVNYDGVVNALDILLVSPPGDVNSDFDVDIRDYARLQACWGPSSGTLDCTLSDINGDGFVNYGDLIWALDSFSGPRS